MSYELKIGEPIRIYAPEVSELSNLWGVYSLPRLWRYADGTLFVRFNGEIDDGFVTEMLPCLYFSSFDEGDTWEVASANDTRCDINVWMGINHPYLKLKNGDTIVLRYMQGRECIDRSIPHIKSFAIPNGADIRYVYRYGDIPDSAKGIELLRYTDKGVLVTPAVMDFPERELALPAEGLGGSGIYEPMPIRTQSNIFASPYMTGLTELADGTIVSLAHGQNPSVFDRQCEEIYLMASNDVGKTWTKRATVASDTSEYPNGYGGDGCEVSLTMTEDGTLVCAMRMELSIVERHVCDTMITVSHDQGYTWCKPFSVAESSVTPHVIALHGGIVALIYGRPGVHMKISEDNGLTWSESHALIGSTLTEMRNAGIPDGEAKYCNMESYSNTFVEKIDDNSFMVLYNCEKTFEEAGKYYHKAAYVRRITVNPT